VSYRIIVWGTGFVGKSVLRDLLDHSNYGIASDTNAVLGSLSKMICRYLLEDEPTQPEAAAANGEGSP
jgi:hypothetical protein